MNFIPFLQSNLKVTREAFSCDNSFFGLVEDSKDFGICNDHSTPPLLHLLLTSTSILIWI